jgi:hypothetical protein
MLVDEPEDRADPGEDQVEADDGEQQLQDRVAGEQEGEPDRHETDGAQHAERWACRLARDPSGGAPQGGVELDRTD